MNSLISEKFTVRRNDVWKKILNFIVAITLLASVVLARIQTYRVSALSNSVDRYRSDLADARRANDRYADAYREAAETNTELGECLSEHVSTLSQLREQLQAVRRQHEKMQAILADLANSGDLVVGSNDSDDSGSINRGDRK